MMRELAIEFSWNGSTVVKKKGGGGTVLNSVVQDGRNEQCLTSCASELQILGPKQVKVRKPRVLRRQQIVLHPRWLSPVLSVDNLVLRMFELVPQV